MLGEVLTVTAFGLTAFDAFLTRRRMHEYGIDVELSTALRVLCRTFGIDLGLLSGMVGPHTIVLALCYKFHALWLLGLIVGMKLKLFQHQLLSIVFERDLKTIKREIDKHNKRVGPAGDSTLQSPTSNDATSQAGPPSSTEHKDE